MSWFARRLPCRLLVAVLLAAASTGATPPKVTGSATARLGFDSNVFLQSVGALAARESFVATGSAVLTATWAEGGDRTSLTYAPDQTRFFEQPDESFTRHRLALALQQSDRLEASASVLLVDGPGDPMIWPAAGGAPAGGGPAVRDRRDATVYRGRVLAPLRAGAWLVRPQAMVYVHDFRSSHLDVAGCQNSVDRHDAALGLDLGRELGDERALFLGWRRGGQDQSRLLAYPEQYDSRYERLLAGAEGGVGAWRGNVWLGPEWRRYDPAGVPAAFGNRHVRRWFVDAALTWTPVPNDRVGLLIRQFEQPGSSGRSTYEDRSYELGWTHTFAPAWSAELTLRAQRFLFRAPVQRDDWIRSATLALTRTLRPGLTGIFELVREGGDSEIPQTEGRTYNRTFAALSLQWSAPAR